MRKFLLFLLFTLAAFAGVSQAQTAEAQRPLVIQGEVAAIDASNNQISLKTKDGNVAIVLSSATVYKRVSPENPTDLKSATPAALSDITVGDRVVAIGKLSDNKKTLAGTRGVYLMTGAHIDKKQQNEQQKWASGFVGKITAVNPAANEVTISLRGSIPEKTVTVAISDKTKFHRYAPGSVKFSEAKPSNFAELKVGDQLRARGEKAPDGARLTAEEVVSGSFKMVAGTITAIDAAKGEVVVKEANTNKVITVKVNTDTLLRRFPPEMAQRMAQMQAMRQSGQQMPQGAPMTGGGQGSAAQPRPASPNGGGQGAGGGMMRQGGGGDVDQMLERLPALTLSELKPGDAIAASSTAGATPDRVTAIKFVAGVEPFLTQPQIPGGNGARPAGGASPSINIPGLDGIGAP